MERVETARTAMKALVVRFSAVGDCVMAAWAATAIRQKYADGVLDWAVESRCAAVVDTDRLVTMRLEFPRDRWKKGRWSPRMWRDQIVHHTRLRGQGYDIGFDLQGHSKTALCLYLAKPKRRIAAFATDSLARRMNPLAGIPPVGTHMVEWFIRTLNVIEPFEMPERPTMPSVDSAGFRSLSNGQSLVSIAVGAGQPGKTVNADTWREVGENLRDVGWQVVYLGGPEERFIAPAGTVSLVGETSIPELSAAIAGSNLLLAGDTGAGHLAAAYGTPVVSVFGSNDPRFYRPYTNRSKVLKRGTGVADFTANEIIREAKELMGEQWPKGS